MNTSSFTGQNLLALLLIVLGSGFLLDELGIINFGSVLSQWWPLAVIGYGLMEFIKSGQKSLLSVIIIGLGAGLLVTRLTNSDVNIWMLLWPGILLFAGLSLLLRKPPTGLSAERSVNEFTIFGGIEKRLSSKEFEGGSMSVAFGGITLDLRQAEMAKDARLDVFVLFGGAEIFVPENCKVVNRSMAMLGGVEDKSRSSKEPEQVLTITGSVLFGGLEIKN